MSKGRKYDEGKIRVELVSPVFMLALSQVLTKGAEKYGDRNWEKGMKWSRCFGAAMRHLWCWWGGREPTSKNFALGSIDPEWNYSHLWHAACCIMFLVHYEENGVGEDDRPPLDEKDGNNG